MIWYVNLILKLLRYLLLIVITLVCSSLKIANSYCNSVNVQSHNGQVPDTALFKYNDIRIRLRYSILNEAKVVDVNKVDPVAFKRSKVT
jgi:hypothetical protein